MSAALAPVDLDDATLADDLHAPAGDAPAAREVLLTGATGFLGGEIASAMLRATGARIHCLVRGSRSQSAAERFDALCARRGLDRTRVRLVEGDVDAIPVAGEGCDTIVHAAGSVNLFAPYETLRASNVLGARRVLELAARSSPRSVHFVSTGGVFLSPRYRGRVVLEDEPLAGDSVPENAYARSKWAADRMMERARARGFAIDIHRPAFVGWHSETGEYGAHDLVALLLRASLATGCAPPLDLQINSTPVDRVAIAIAGAVAHGAARGRTFHIVHPRAIPFATLTGRLGLPLAPLPAWTRAVAEAVPSLARFAELVAATQTGGLAGGIELRREHDRTYDDRRLTETLGKELPPSPELHGAYLATLLRRLSPSGAATVAG